eukprot:scaffold1280_cov379-Prasinococcus_capsulatus_cf.AAC.11
MAQIEALPSWYESSLSRAAPRGLPPKPPPPLRIGPAAGPFPSTGCQRTPPNWPACQGAGRAPVWRGVRQRATHRTQIWPKSLAGVSQGSFQGLLPVIFIHRHCCVGDAAYSARESGAGVEPREPVVVGGCVY